MLSDVTPRDEGSPIDPAFLRSIERLEELIEAETTMLRSGLRVDFEALNMRKTHALLEFARIARALPKDAAPALESRLAQLRDRLAANAHALQLHLQAMSEITDMIVAGIRKDESDGTYARGGAPHL